MGDCSSVKHLPIFSWGGSSSGHNIGDDVGIDCDDERGFEHPRGSFVVWTVTGDSCGCSCSCCWSFSIFERMDFVSFKVAFISIVPWLWFFLILAMSWSLSWFFCVSKRELEEEDCSVRCSLLFLVWFGRIVPMVVPDKQVMVLSVVVFGAAPDAVLDDAICLVLLERGEWGQFAASSCPCFDFCWRKICRRANNTRAFDNNGDEEDCGIDCGCDFGFILWERGNIGEFNTFSFPSTSGTVTDFLLCLCRCENRWVNRWTISFITKLYGYFLVVVCFI